MLSSVNNIVNQHLGMYYFASNNFYSYQKNIFLKKQNENQMRKSRLSSSEIRDLINKYQSELKKLEFQTEEVIATITELQNWLESVEESEKNTLLRVRRKPKITAVRKSAQGKVQRKRGRPPKKEKKKAEKASSLTKTKIEQVRISKGYKLSNWDEWVIAAITQNGKPQITQEIIDYVRIRVQDSGMTSNEEEIKNKVIRSLQKLVNRRGDLIKVPYKGKGHAYALPGMSGTKRKITKKSKKK